MRGPASSEDRNELLRLLTNRDLGFKLFSYLGIFSSPRLLGLNRDLRALRSSYNEVWRRNLLELGLSESVLSQITSTPLDNKYLQLYQILNRILYQKSFLDFRFVVSDIQITDLYALVGNVENLNLFYGPDDYSMETLSFAAMAGNSIVMKKIYERVCPSSPEQFSKILYCAALSGNDETIYLADSWLERHFLCNPKYTIWLGLGAIFLILNLSVIYSAWNGKSGPEIPLLFIINAIACCLILPTRNQIPKFRHAKNLIAEAAALGGSLELVEDLDRYYKIGDESYREGEAFHLGLAAASGNVRLLQWLIRCGGNPRASYRIADGVVRLDYFADLSRNPEMRSIVDRLLLESHEPAVPRPLDEALAPLELATATAARVVDGPGDSIIRRRMVP